MHALYFMLRDNLPAASALSSMALFPFALHALVSGRVPVIGKLCALTAYAALAALMAGGEVHPLIQVIAQGVAFAFVTLGAFLVWAIGPYIGRSSPPRNAGLFVALSVLLIALPGALLPAPASFIAVAWGFELVFKAYSYLHDGQLQGERPTFEQALFYLLIDPVLCFPERSRRVGAASLRVSALSRCLLGIFALLAHTLLISVLLSSLGLPLGTAAASSGAASLSLFVFHYAGRFLAGYARHSGGASLAIGAMGVLGFETPERYHYPWLAKSPADFWRRWNTYLGSWARRYVFVPLAGRLQRKLRGRSGATEIAKSVAVMLTFALIGVLHDFGVYAQYNRWPLGGLLVFSLNGLALLLFSAAGNGLGAVLGRLRVAQRSRVSAGGSTLSRVFFLPFLFATVWIAIPTMSTDFALTLEPLWRAVGGGGSGSR